MSKSIKRILIIAIVLVLIVSMVIPLYIFRDSLFGSKEKNNDNSDNLSFNEEGETAMQDLKLWYDTMAGNHHSGNPEDMNESFYKALPQGNGRIGAMIYGNYPDEHIELNEATFWSAGPGTNDRNGAADYYNEAVELALDDKLIEANDLVQNRLMGGGEARYQSVGSLDLRFGHEKVSDYERELDLRTGLVTSDYIYNGVKYHRESFVSYPDQVMVMIITADKPGSITMTAEYDCSLKGQYTRSVDGEDTLVMDGRCDNDLGRQGAVNFQTRTRIVAEGGTSSHTDTAITVTGADSVMIVTGVRTNFINYNDVSADQAALVQADMEAVKGKSYDELKEAFLADYQELFGRVDIELGNGNESAKNMKQRIEEFNITNDPDMVEILFQYGRYMMICGSRDSEPMNLQGIWNKFRNPVWGSKFTTNINYEMNYWPAFTTNLAECFEPFAKKAQGLAEAGKHTAKTTYGLDSGWTVNHNTDLWNHTGPIDGAWGFWPIGGSWISTQLYDAYRFTLDEDYLKEIYPIIESSADFLRQIMYTKEIRGQEYQVIAPSNSPEIAINHTSKGQDTSGVPGSFITYSVAMDNAIGRELFQNVIEAADILGVEDNEILTDIKGKVSDIRPNQYGEFGQLLEWQYDYDDEYNGHRHISHLFGLYPGDSGNARVAPELYKGAAAVLKSRGDMGTGWSEGWKLNCWARLEDGEHAYELIKLLITPASGGMWDGGGRLYDNLWDAHPPFQIDGNFGFTSGVAEMLMQSQNNEIVLLPAVPARWSDGHANGLCARGGFEVSQKWADGKLTSAKIYSKLGGLCNVRYGTKTVSFMTEAGKTYTLNGNLDIKEDVTYYGNVALNKNVSTNGKSADIENIVDGDSTTLWTSDEGKGDGSEIVIDLGSEYTISRWVLEADGSAIESKENDPVTGKKVMTADNPREFVLSYSNDNSSWEVADAVYGNELDINDRNVAPFTARYIKLTLTKAASYDGGTAKIEEIQLWAESDKPFDADNILNEVKFDGNKLSGLSSDIEYSIDATNAFNGTWESSISGSVTLKGDNIIRTVRIREKANPGNMIIMGSLSAKDDIAVTGVTIPYSELRLTRDESIRLEANIFPKEATNKTVNWISSNPNVVTIDSDGNLEFVKPGVAIVTVRTEDGHFTAECKVIASIPVESISVDDIDLAVGDQATLDVSFAPNDASNQNLYYKSSNPEIVTIDESGLMIALMKGETEITVTSAYDSRITITAKVTVNDVALENIEISEALSVYETMEAPIEVKFTPENATDKSLSWASSDESIATVDANGIVTGIGVGEADIIASTADGSIIKTCHIEVLAVTHIESIAFEVDALDLMLGEALTCKVNVYPENANNHKIVYSSDNESVAIVDAETGKIKAIGSGSATITAASVDGNKTSTLTVNIAEPQKAKIETVSANWEKDHEKASMAVDGDLGSKWCHDIDINGETCLPSALTVKLDKVYAISSWRVASAGAAGWDVGLHTVEWSIEISDDGENWREIAHIYDNEEADRQELLDEIVETQWVRLVIYKNQPPNVAWECVRIHEFEIFGYAK